MMVKLFMALVMCGGTVVALCDDRIEAFRVLREECLKYSSYCETNKIDIAHRADTITNTTSTMVHILVDVHEMSNVYDLCQATNIEFEVNMCGGVKKMLGFVVRYDNGKRVCVEYSGHRISKIHRQIGQKKFQVYKILSDKLKSDGLFCYDIEEIGDGEDFIFTNIRYYENGRIVREEPPSRLSKMMSERGKKGVSR